MLKDDDSRFVQKSVANCINDILKDNYDAGMELLKTGNRATSKNTKWIISHALRNERKKNNPEALALLGIGSNGGAR